MYIVEMREEGMKELCRFIIEELNLEAILARTDQEEMIALYTTEQLISPSNRYVLSNISKKYGSDHYEVQFINMTINEQKTRAVRDINEIKNLISLIKDMVMKEEKVKNTIASWIGEE